MPKASLLLRIFIFLIFALPWSLVFDPHLMPSLDTFFGGMCPRLPERTLMFWGEPMVLCSRCAGVFAGVALAAIFDHPRLTKSMASNVFLLASAVMLLDVVTQELGIHPIWHLTRLATGLTVGYSIWLVLAADARKGGRLADDIG